MLDVVKAIYDFMYWITTLQLYGNRMNILGALWFLTVILYTYIQIRQPFNSFREKMGKKKLNRLEMFVISVIPVTLLHFVTDEINTAIYLMFGGWEAFGAKDIPFSWEALWSMKFDVYISSVALILSIYFLYIYKFFKVTKASLFWIGSFSIMAFSAHSIMVGDFVLFQGWDRFWRFWIFYPLSYFIISMLFLSMIKKRESMFGWLISIGRHKKMKELSDPWAPGLNLGCGLTEFSNKLNVDRKRFDGVDLIGDARFLPFRSGCLKEIIMDEVLEHIEEDKIALLEIHRVLSQDGALLLSVPHRGWLAKLDKFLLHRNEYHASYSKLGLQDALSHSGFCCSEMFIYGTLPHFLGVAFGGTLFAVSRPGSGCISRD